MFRKIRLYANLSAEAALNTEIAGDKMTAEILLIINENGREITRVKYYMSSACPIKGNAVIEISELLGEFENESSNINYLKSVGMVFDIIVRNKKTDMLSDISLCRFEFAMKIIKAHKLEYLRRKRKRIKEENQSEIMINAAKRIISIIEKNNLEQLSVEDISVMKRYLYNVTPPFEELKAFPDDLKQLIRPAFEVMKILIELSPAESDKKYLKEINEFLQ